MSEKTNYKANLQGFISAMQSAFVEKVTFEEDMTPTFNKSTLPFDFRYCFSTTFYTNKGNFLIHTSATTFGFETFWIVQVEPKEGGEWVKIINSQVKGIKVWDGYDHFPYKLSVQFENEMLTIFAAEVHDKVDGSCDIKINDEMILVFEDRSEAEKFEAMINKAKRPN